MCVCVCLCMLHSTKQQLYGHLPPITKTIQVRLTRHAGHCWWSRDELISEVLLWTHSHGRAKAKRPARTYIQQLCADTGCSPEDLSEAMDDWEEWRERVRDIHADSTTWWWWWYIYIYIYIYKFKSIPKKQKASLFFYICHHLIILSCRKHGYPWPSIATSPYRSSPLAGLQGYIPYPHIGSVCMFALVVLLLLGHLWGSIRVHHLWARPCFSTGFPIRLIFFF